MKTSMITSVLCTGLLCGAPAFASCTRADLTGTWRVYTLWEGYVVRCSIVMEASGDNSGPTSYCYGPPPLFEGKLPMTASLKMLSNCRVTGRLSIIDLELVLYFVDAWISTSKDSMSGMMWEPGDPSIGVLFSAVK